MPVADRTHAISNTKPAGFMKTWCSAPPPPGDRASAPRGVRSRRTPTTGRGRHRRVPMRPARRRRALRGGAPLDSSIGLLDGADGARTRRCATRESSTDRRRRPTR
jgi:hypothetical protein